MSWSASWHSIFSRKQKDLSTRYALHYSLPLSIVPMYIQLAAVRMYPKHLVFLPRCFFDTSLTIQDTLQRWSTFIHIHQRDAERVSHIINHLLAFLLPPHSPVPSVTSLGTTAPLTLKLKPLEFIQTRHITFCIDVFIMIKIRDNTLSITTFINTMPLPLLLRHI